MDTFKLIYRILRFLDCMTKCEEFDYKSFSANHNGVSEKQWADTLEMLVDRELIKGISINRAADGSAMTSLLSPRITLTGLEHLRGNEFMLKESSAAKGSAGG